jgi:hypothetical protein
VTIDNKDVRFEVLRSYFVIPKKIYTPFTKTFSLPNDMNDFNFQASEFFMFGALMIIDMVIFGLMARSYTYANHDHNIKTKEEEEENHKRAEQNNIEMLEKNNLENGKEK